MRSAVLFLIFNRPDTTQQVFEAIRAAKPPRLYVAADGARPNQKGETERSIEARSIATAVDWPCEVKTLFRESNLGCGKAVSSAIDWFFSYEPEGIILEDDTLPNRTFFTYCDKLLEKYRDSPQIMSISGSFFGNSTAHTNNYYYSNYSLMWGWATWARAWRNYSFEVHPGRFKLFPIYRKLSRILPALYWYQISNLLCRKKIDTWDYQWILTILLKDGLVCRPCVNLVKNLGFRADATHTINKNDALARISTGSISGDLRCLSSNHEPNDELDQVDESLWANITIKNIISRFLRS